MKNWRIFGLLALSLPTYASAQTVIQNVTYGSGPVVVSGTSTVTASTNVNVPADSTVLYQASASIALQPGFHVFAGARFFAHLGATVDSDGDGLPDAWELAYGLNPNNPADASQLAAAGGSLTNLQMYQAGLYPLPVGLTTLQNASLPAGIDLVIRTPEYRFYGISTNTYQISSLPQPP